MECEFLTALIARSDGFDLFFASSTDGVDYSGYYVVSRYMKDDCSRLRYSIFAM